MPNSLTRDAGLRLGPVVLETLVKHYFDRIKKEDAQHSRFATQLHQDELLYHEAFNIVKSFLEASTYHTVEEVQALSNNKTPSPPWVHVVRILVPVSCCDKAAVHVTQALGGEEFTKKLVGGTKWWQVRGVQGVDAEWITARKDYLEDKRRSKAKHKKRSNADPTAESTARTSNGLPDSNANDDNAYKEEMDEMRCILYAHGGGYYFGSVDQERYSIQRHARKIRGRVFAINYRLAPQYPFPCALQDILAAYLFLIDPPCGVSHRPVKPEHLVVAGDSAGGGLTLALLQVLRDTGLPLPAGGILISPWCDLTHSFPSVHMNTATDVIPPYGLSFHKPSPLWPPPPDEMTRKVRSKLRTRIRRMVQYESKEEHSTEAPSDAGIHQSPSSGFISLSSDDEALASGETPVNVGTTTPPPSGDKNENQTIRLQGSSGDLLVVEEQVHLYTQNSMIGHPLVSAAFSYLGGLPPLFFIASDKEVLRDEIIYTAHKAADPSRFPIKEEASSLYPPLIGIEARYNPTAVHLQVYDDTAHVLPVLFSFSTPGKFCYRAIASFTKHVTKMDPSSRSSTGLIVSPSSTSPPQTSTSGLSRLSRALSTPEFLKGKTGSSSNSFDHPIPSSMSPKPFRSPFSRSSLPSRAKSLQVPKSEPDQTLPKSTSRSRSSNDIDAEATLRASDSAQKVQQFAGEYSVYCDDQDVPSWKEGMIRERVSTRGVIRPLEPESKLEAFAFPQEILGTISERAVRRYLEGKARFDKKFAKDIHDIQKRRKRNLKLSHEDVIKNMAQLQGSKNLQSKDGKGKARDTTKGIKEGLEAVSASWNWAWALELDERPPPSSIVSRRDTSEARRLARIADQAVLQEYGQISANSLWAVVVNFLTDREHKQAGSSVSDRKHQPQPPLQRRRSLFASLRP